MMKRNIMIGILASVLFLGGILSGVRYRHYQNSKTVVFRIGSERETLDYDLLSAVRFLEYSFKQRGYRVLPWRYPGEFYHQKGDNAAINVFIRGFEYFYDTRMNKDALNIYYLHRFINLYAEELQNYDFYLSSQKGLVNFFAKRSDVGYFGSGAVPHELLKVDGYDYDVLFIYEDKKSEYEQYLESMHRFKKYSSLNFGRLSEEERMQELAKARLVVYVVDYALQDDKDYIPCAVLDIISYGRPVMFKFNKKMQYWFGQDIYLFDDDEDMKEQTYKALHETDRNREAKAQRAREKLFLKENDDISLIIPN